MEKLNGIFKEGNYKTSAILYFICALLWAGNAAMSYHALVINASDNRIFLYLDGFLALFNLGLALGKALKYRNEKIWEYSSS